MASFGISISLVADKLTRRARMTAPTLEEYILSLSRSGMSVTNIRKLLLSEEGERILFSPIRNAFSSTAKDGLEYTRQLTREDELSKRLPERTLYVWIMDGGENHCPGCIDRSGWDAMTMEEWSIVGKPRAAATECGSHCNCDLVPVVE